MRVLFASGVASAGPASRFLLAPGFATTGFVGVALAGAVGAGREVFKASGSTTSVIVTVLSCKAADGSVDTSPSSIAARVFGFEGSTLDAAELLCAVSGSTSNCLRASELAKGTTAPLTTAPLNN